MCDCDITIPKGDDGDIGPIGLTGEKGDKGDTGNTGANGTNGTNGTNALEYFGTSVTSTNLGTLGSTKTIIISPVATAFQVGSRIRVASTASPSTNYFEGVVGSNNTGTGSIAIVAIDNIVGSATLSAWTVSIAGDKGTNVVVEAPPGCIFDYVATTAPTGYLLCNGASYLRATYPALFAIIGTTFGAADGTHFNVPDTRKRVRLGYDGSTLSIPTSAPGMGVENYAALGNVGGEKSHATTQAELPEHQHSLVTDGASSTIVVVDTTGYSVLTGAGGGAVPLGNGSALSVDGISIASTASITAGNTGDGTTDGLAGDAHENRQPYIVLTQIIKT